MAAKKIDVRVVATKNGYDNIKVREVGEVFVFKGYGNLKRKPSWCEPYVEPKQPELPKEED